MKSVLSSTLRSAATSGGARRAFYMASPLSRFTECATTPATAGSAAERPRRGLSSSPKHETWRAEGDLSDNLPSVKRRDGTVAEIDKHIYVSPLLLIG